MSKTPLPSKKDILAYIAQSPHPVGKREICKHFGIKGEARNTLKRMLRREGLLEKKRKKSTHRPERGPEHILGILHHGTPEHIVRPVDRRNRKTYYLPATQNPLPKDGELVEIEIKHRKQARIVRALGNPHAPKSISLIALATHNIPIEFSPECLAEVQRIPPITTLEGREDLRALPFVTIDPEDARDHDDALYAQRDGENWVVWVAIADVAAYVAPDTHLDAEAKERGNSCYFPDRMVPMLPERLSTDLCSLRENVDRPCLALKMVFAANGEKISHTFIRSMMRSHASLTYTQAQEIADGAPSDLPIKDLFAAYACAKQARDVRAPLELEITERKIILDDNGQVASIRTRERFAAHKLVEEFMIQANVCAAETLEQRQKPTMYRVHEPPSPEKLDALREALKATAFSLRKSAQVFPKQFNTLLRKAKDTPQEEGINIAVLRAQMQAYYTPENLGHFGLNLARYAHFTSPIRRYSDVLVHRALTDTLSETDAKTMSQTATHISQTERRAMMAERDTTDRYLAAFMSQHVDATFEARISGITGAGLFVKTISEGAEGFIPISTLGTEYFRYDKTHQALIGERTNTTLVHGLKTTVKLREATPMTGGLLFELVSIEGLVLEGKHKSQRKRQKKQ